MAVAAITGVAGGVGEAVANGFAEAGHHSALLDRGRPCLADCPGKISLATDLTRPDEFDAGFGRIWDEFGRFDAVVNVAGMTRRVHVSQMKADGWTGKWTQDSARCS